MPAAFDAKPASKSLAVRSKNCFNRRPDVATGNENKLRICRKDPAAFWAQDKSLRGYPQ